MSMAILLVAVILALTLVGSAFRTPDKTLKLGAVVVAVLLIFFGFLFSSVRFVGSNEIGLIKKNALGPALKGGQIIATKGEMGVQAQVLSPGWHPWYWPILYDVSAVPLVEIDQDQVGLVEAQDGQPLASSQLFAPEVTEDEFKQMLDDATQFLSSGGRKGPQSNVLKPGKYRINTELFKITKEKATDVPNASVAVLKANFGDPPTIQQSLVDGNEQVLLADDGERGVRAKPLPPGKYPINTKAYEVTIVSTKQTIVRFTKHAGQSGDRVEEEREINVRTTDGFTFPVDVRIEYNIEAQNAPIVVAKLKDEEGMRAMLNSTVRAIFRNNAESVKALDYVNQRSHQETQSLSLLQLEMAKVGVTVTAVRIGDVGDEETLGDLLKTQRDREIATQEQITFQEQQKAAEQKKELTRTEQEAEEERKLATASYDVKIAEQNKEKRLISASAEAEAIKIEAAAQADAFKLIADQIGKGNAALMEALKIVGESRIQITPRVMVGANASASSTDAGTVALIGTMLDKMVDDEPDNEAVSNNKDK